MEGSLLERRKQVPDPAYRPSCDRPLQRVRRRGTSVWDIDGREYLGAYNNLPWVRNCHPKVVAALSSQVAEMNTRTRYLHEIVVDYGKKSVATIPHGPPQVMFTCTGSEANDLALRVACAVSACTSGGTAGISRRFRPGQPLLQYLWRHPVSAAVKRGGLQVIEDIGLMGNARDVGSYILTVLQALAPRHVHVGDVCAAGHYATIELVEDCASRSPSAPMATRVIKQLRENNVLVGICGTVANRLKIRPPLYFSFADATRLIETPDLCRTAQQLEH